MFVIAHLATIGVRFSFPFRLCICIASRYALRAVPALPLHCGRLFSAFLFAHATVRRWWCLPSTTAAMCARREWSPVELRAALRRSKTLLPSQITLAIVCSPLRVPDGGIIAACSGFPLRPADGLAVSHTRIASREAEYRGGVVRCLLALCGRTAGRVLVLGS